MSEENEVFVRLRVHLDAPRGGLLLSGPICETVRIEHGKLRRIRLFLDERDALEAAALLESGMSQENAEKER